MSKDYESNANTRYLGWEIKIMIEIDTSQDKWQKKMAQTMKKGEQFRLATSDEKFAKALKKGKFNVGTVKLILFGGGVAGAGAGAAVASLAGAAKISGVMFIMGMADPEPISKTVLLVISIATSAIGCGFVYRLIRNLQENKYTFKIQENHSSDKKWVFNANPV
jgi:hypothetical protein